MINGITTGMVHGGAVQHIIRETLGAFGQTVSVCGRWVTPGSSDARLCKTCSRISGIVELMELNDAEKMINSCGCERREHMTPERFTAKREHGKKFTAYELALFRDVIEDYRKGSDNDACWIGTLMILTDAPQLRMDDPKVVEATHRGGNGGGNVIDPKNAKPARSPFGGSEKQRELILSLVRQIDEINAEIYPNLKPLIDSYTEEFVNGLNTQKKVSDDIKGLFTILDVLKKKRNEKRAEIRIQEAKTNPAEDGYYMLGDTFVCVKWNRAKTGQYATVWDGDSWEYDAKESYKLVQDAKARKLPRVTPEDARRFGELYGCCIRCRRTLTNPESIADAMGPVCSSKMGW